MKLAKILCLAVLLAVSAAAAKAGSIGADPKLVVNGVPPPPGPNARPLTILTFTDAVRFPSTPLVLSYSLIHSGTEELEYIGPKAKITNMWIEITGIPVGAQHDFFGCSSDIFASLGGGNCGGAIPFGPQIGFDLTGGTLNKNDDIFVSITPIASDTPEPSTLLMFLGLGPVVGFAKKRWGAKLFA
jgi:PEP-CTERM motif